MKFALPQINTVFDTEISLVNTLIIENQKFFLSILSDMETQLQGLSGNCIVSDNNCSLQFSKHCEVLSTFVPFTLNVKSIVTKIISVIEKESLNPENYVRTMELLGELESHLYDVSQCLPLDISFENISMGAIIKAAGVTLNDDYERLGEKIIDYFELVNEFEHKKLFITVNLRSYIDDKEAESFMDTVIRHKYHLLMIESHEYERLSNEKRYIVDESLCEIS